MFETIFTFFKEYGALLIGLIKKYGIKTVIVVVLLCGFMFGIGYMVEKRINMVVPQTVEQSIDANYEKQETIHQENLLKSDEVYSEAKIKLRSTLKDVGCEYIYLIEYHNGSTNMATSFPFRKFDVTMDICKDGVPYINTTMLKDEHITKYDIFDNPEFTKQQFMYCSRENFKKVDYKLYQMMDHNKKIQWVYTYNLYYGDDILGAVLVLSYDKINLKTFMNHMHELDVIFNQ
jgi:hypothetical protein